MRKYFPLGLFLLFSIIYSFIFIIKHDFQFQTFGWDSGFFDQVLWKSSHGDFGYSTIFNHSLMSSNFEPILFLLAPLLRLFPDIRLLFIAQTTVAVSAVFPLYFLARQRTKSDFFSCAVGLSFLLLVTFQHAILNGFTQSFFVAPLFAWSFYFLENKMYRRYLLMLLAIIATKEEFSLLLIPFGISVALFYKATKIGLSTAIIGLVSFIFLIYFLNPLVSPGNRNWAHFDIGYGQSGHSPQEVAINTLTKPQVVLPLLLDDVTKRKTIFEHFFSFGFFPFLSPIPLLPIVQEYFTRFINTAQPPKWLGNDFDFGVFLAISSIYGARALRKYLSFNTLGLILIIFALFSDFYFHGPLNSLFKLDFYHQQQWSKNNHDILSLVPKNVSVAANNSLVPHLSHRDKIYQLPEIGNADYIAVDLHDNPNAFAPINLEMTKKIISDLLILGKYRQIVKIDQALLLTKI